MVTDPFVTWLLEGGVGPALAAVPVNLAGNAGVGAAQRLFRRLRHTDGLSRLVMAATGTAVDLEKDEFNAIRQLLESPQTWRALGHSSAEDLAIQIASCLPARAGRTAADSHMAALVVARGLLEFAVADVDPGLFQKLLLARLQRMESGQATKLDKGIFDLQADLVTGFGGMMELLRRVLDQLPPGPARRGEIAVYLAALIDWVNTDPWPQDVQLKGPTLTPAAVERELRITALANNGEPDLDADQLAQRCHRLVILGGPGAGKTWLAKRTARRSAEEAIKALTAGASLDEVELPLYTTCSRLLTAAGDPRSAAVSSALDYELGDLGGSRLNASVREFFTERNAPTVLVIDSLDEAQGIGKRLRQADTLPWRIVLTSRPNSWNNQLVIEEQNKSHFVGQIQPLRYPDDVEPFVQRWFAERPSRGNDLVIQIAQRPALQQAATVPLILAFYCILGGDQSLPQFRRDLYAKVVNRMLTGRWRGDEDGRPDPGTCTLKLRSWAWSGATWHPVSQIGTWADDLPTPSARLNKTDENALDHVAVPIGLPDIDTGLTLRRFVHRSLREHLVADRVAGLPAEEAATILLRHLWYDSDWEYAAPAAIAMHPQHDQLLRGLIRRAIPSDQITVDLSVIDPWFEVRRFLVRIAAESGEEDWSSEIAAIIGHARVELAQSLQLRDLAVSDISAGMGYPSVELARSFRFRDLVESAHWRTSNQQVREALLEHLAHRPGVRELADALIRMDPSAEDKHHARKSILRRLNSEPANSTALVDALIRLDPSAEDKHLARQALLGESADAQTMGTPSVDALVRLDPSGADKRLARQVLLRQLTSAPSNSLYLVEALTRLDPSAEDKRLARQILLVMLARDRTGGVKAREFVSELLKLDLSAYEKRAARHALLVRLASPQTSSTWRQEPVGSPLDGLAAGLMDRLVGSLVDGLVQLASSAEDKDLTRQSLFELLASQRANGQVSRRIVDGLVQLDLPEEDRRRARQALLGQIGSRQSGSIEVRQLIEGLSELDPSPEERNLAFRLVQGHLAGRRDSRWATSHLVRRLIQLASSAENKRQAYELLLSLLTHQQDGAPDADVLVNGLRELDLLAEDKLLARQALLKQLTGQPSDWTATPIVTELMRLDPPAEERHLAQQTLLKHLTNPATDRKAISGLVDALTELEPSAQERYAARQALLKDLADPAPNREIVLSLIPELTKLEFPEEERRIARQALLKYLADPATNYRSHEQIQGHLAGLGPTIEDLATWRTWTFPPTTALLSAVRGNATLDDWIKALQAPRGASGPQTIRPDNGGFQHYVNNSALQEAILAKQPVTALCEWTWIPSRSAPAGGDIGNLPVCPNCKNAYESARPE